MIDMLRLVALILLVPAVALAEPPKSRVPIAQSAPDVLTQEARQRWEEGIRAVHIKDYERARIAFKQAYALKPHDRTLRNLGVMEVYTGHYLEAARNLTRALRSNTEATEAELEELRLILAEAEAHVGKLSIEVEPHDAEIRVNGEPLEHVASRTEWHVPPGNHTVVLHKVGFRSETRQVSVKAAERSDVKVKLREESVAASSAPPVARPPASSSGEPAHDDSMQPAKTIVLIGSGALTVASAAVWAVFGSKYGDAQDEARTLRARAHEEFGDRPCARGRGAGSAVCTELNDRNHERADAAQVANYAMIGTLVFGAATVAATTWILWPQDHPDSSRAGMTIRPWLSVRDAGCAFTGRF